MSLAQPAEVGNPESVKPAPGPSSRFGKFNTFIDHGQAELTRRGCASAARLWLTIWRFENAETDTARVGTSTLAECYGTDRRNITRMLAQLDKNGFLKVVESGAKGRGSCAVYRLFVPAENASPRHISDATKCVTTTHFQPSDKCVSQTHLSPENASPEHGKCVTTTHVQKEQKKDIPAAKPAGGGASKKPKPPQTATNPNHKPAVDYFCAAWHKRHGCKYGFEGKDAAAVKAILKAVDNSLERFTSAVDHYLASDAPFILKQGHSLCELRRTQNRWLALATGPPRTRSNRPPDFASELPETSEAA